MWLFLTCLVFWPSVQWIFKSIIMQNYSCIFKNLTSGLSVYHIYGYLVIFKSLETEWNPAHKITLGPF